MPLKEKLLSVFMFIKGEGKLWWLNLNKEYPQVIMLDVIIALLPACIFGCILFGIKALLILLTSCACAVLTEFLWNLISKKPQTIGNLSALVTGLLFGMCMPDSIPLWIVAIGSVFAIAVVKQLLGGLGYNLTNPAVTSVILLKFCFSKAMTAYHLPFYHTVENCRLFFFGLTFRYAFGSYRRNLLRFTYYRRQLLNYKKNYFPYCSAYIYRKRSIFKYFILTAYFI